MIEFELNGVTVTSEDDPNTPVLWVIRDSFKLKGSKFGCGAGLCGACTMQIDGKAVRTCILPVAAVAGQSVTTIEGLSQDGALHALQTAWVEHSVPQCGYCQSGQIMSASALLAYNAMPNDDDIDVAMSGNICRCGTYGRIRAAVKQASQAINKEDA